jgi:hypothetical protein
MQPYQREWHVVVGNEPIKLNAAEQSFIVVTADGGPVTHLDEQWIQAVLNAARTGKPMPPPSLETDPQGAVGVAYREAREL